MTQSGWRKPTPELLQAERFAEVGEQLTTASCTSALRGWCDFYERQPERQALGA